MNDTELDDMLNQWEAAEVPARLRESIKLPSPQRKRRLSWPSWHLSKGLLAGAIIGGGMCFLGISAAFPQVLAQSGRFTVVSEYFDHKDDGSSVLYETRASTAQQGREIILVRASPDNWMMNVHFFLFDRLHRLFDIGTDPTKPPISMALSDCSVPALSVIGHEAILGYKTIVQREVAQDGFRYTEWRSRDLDCIVMKYTKEELRNGELKLTDERRPILVKINHAQ